MTEKIGYARVSTTAQNLDAQIDLLEKEGCTKIFADKISGTKKERPEWDKLLEYARNGDVIVITELSRMSRSLSHLLEIVKIFDERNIQIQSLRENIDTTTATGRAFISIMGAIIQMEIELKKERTTAGREAAKARGKSGGRPRIDPDKLEQARILYENSEKTASEICETFGFSRRAFFNHLQKVKEMKGHLERRYV
jgi:DNA invertase Pin-like site-specific DNA recombinase